MGVNRADERVTAEAVTAQILEVLNELPKEYDAVPITAATELGTIGIDSVNFIYLFDELRRTYGVRDLYNALRKTGRALAHQRVSDLAEIVCAAVNGAG